MNSGRRISLLSSACLALILLFGGNSAGRAAELVMFEQAFCEWCEVWDEEVGVVYGKTSESKHAPLRRVDIHKTRPADLAGVKRVIFTPTFVLMENGAEVGRILGYPGEDFFWSLLNQMMKRLKNSPVSSQASGKGKRPGIL